MFNIFAKNILQGQSDFWTIPICYFSNNSFRDVRSPTLKEVSTRVVRGWDAMSGWGEA